MKKPKEKKIKTPVKKSSAPRPSGKKKKEKSGNEQEELFGVHIISDADIENHFGTSAKKSDSETLKEEVPTGDSKNKR